MSSLALPLRTVPRLRLPRLRLATVRPALPAQHLQDRLVAHGVSGPVTCDALLR